MLAGVIVLPTVSAETFGAAWPGRQEQALVTAKAWVEVQATSSFRLGACAINWLVRNAEGL
jgi:hypothetical protein